MAVCATRNLLVAVVCLLRVSSFCWAKIQSKVHCFEEQMVIEVSLPDDVFDIYLQQLKHYPDEACQPKIEDNKATFRLSLTDVYQCGVTRLINRITGTRAYYHHIVLEYKESTPTKEVLSVKCLFGKGNSTRQRRDILPADFKEEDVVEITSTFEEKAPMPQLSVAVKQGGQMVTGELNVNPGTPLQMEIYLDKESAPIYGLLVSYMQVTDTKVQEETIIFNGCSVDPYLFENFNTVDGDFLSAKFRAFKFPESTYVLFKGTVNVCLDKCRGVECSNGQVGYGRRRREVAAMPADPNKVFEVTLTTFIKVNRAKDEVLEQDMKMMNNESQILADHESNIISMEPNLYSNFGQELLMAAEEIREKFEYDIIDSQNCAPVVSFFFTPFVIAVGLLVSLY